MTANYLGPEGPPDEAAYSRVTNPERFAPLHDIAAGLLNRLEATFEVERAKGYGLDPELESVKLARPSTRLVPRDPRAAPIVVAFTAFPGVFVRFGRWYIDTFPGCGCDACGETLTYEAERLNEMIDDVTVGHFREAIRLPAIGDAWATHEFWSSGGRSAGESRLDRARALRLLDRSDRSSYEWSP
jgi:Family of unknown function (DUF6226)